MAPIRRIAPLRSADPLRSSTVPELRACWRARALTDLHGDVLDVGAGEGSSLGYLPSDAHVTLLEPHAASLDRLSRLATGRPGSRVLPSSAERIPLEDASIDSAVCSSVLCSVTDQDRSLQEIHRVLRPGGRLVLLEHVAAPRGTWVRRAQRAVAPFSRVFDHGCDPARDTERALARSALTVVELHRVDARGPWGIPIPHLAAVLTRGAG